MPELPEVETIAQQLNQQLAGLRIQEVYAYSSGREFPSTEAVVSGLRGRVIKGCVRRAKLLLFALDDGRTLVGHLKMTGRFLWHDKEVPVGKHDRLRLVFQGQDGVMTWADVRKFGYVKLMSGDEVARVLGEYGPEPLQVSAEELAERLHLQSSRTIKAVLLDQGVIAGCGNIYADETCFRAGVLPTRRVRDLSAGERLALAHALQGVLRASLAQRGTSANDYVDLAGEKGGFLALLQVYGRKGKPCVKCETPIEKVTLAGRGTHFCSHCQQ